MGFRILALATVTAAACTTHGGPAARAPAPPGALAGPGAGVVDVRSMGAKGDGVADDTAAIQAACARGGSVLLPPGTYAVTRPIELSGRLRIEGAGATIVSSDPTGALFRASGDLAGFVLRDVVLRTTRRDLEKRGEALFAVDYHVLDGALLENVTFDAGASFQNGISLAAEIGTRVENVTIRDCAFTGPSAGVELVHHVDLVPRISGVKILHNRFVHNGLKDDQFAGFAISLSGPISRVEVIGNDIRGYPYAGIEIVGPNSGFDADGVIQGNTVVDTGRGIVTETGRGPLGGRISRVSIVGNVVVGNRFFQRLRALADSVVEGNVFETRRTTPSKDHQYDFFAILECEGLLVANNSFRLELPAEEAARAVVAFVGVRASHVSGNAFESSGPHVVRVGSAEARSAELRSTDNSFAANRFVQHDGAAGSAAVAFTGRETTRNTLTSSTIVTRHPRAASAQAAGNVAIGTVTIRSDTGEVGTLGDGPLR